ncbi:hypothetical protein BJX70DRAFT_77800 [Aspergillus crustosus]
MASFSQLYTVLTVPFLASWTLLALGFTAINVLNSDRSLIQLLASSSLFTFLICRLLVVSQPAIFTTDSLAQLVTTFPRQSARNALVFLLLTLTWLYELLFKSLALLFITVFGGGLATAIYTDAFVEVDENGERTVPVQEDVTSVDEPHALAAIDQFRDKSGGGNPLEIVKMIPPKLLIYFVVVVWVNFATLGLYVLRLALGSLRRVFGARPAELAVKAGEKGEKKVEKGDARLTN